MSKTPSEANSGKKNSAGVFLQSSVGVAPGLRRSSAGAPAELRRSSEKSKNSGSGAFKTPEIFPELRRSSD